MKRGPLKLTRISRERREEREREKKALVKKVEKEMGCCFSAGKVTAPPVSDATTTTNQIPPHIEEETVKEVVVQSVSVSVPDIPTAPERQVSDSEAPLPVSLPTPTPTPEISLDIKSDISSVTPSHSFSTATTASFLEDDALSKPHRPPPPSRRHRPQRISRSPGERYSPQGKLRPRLVRERPSPQPIRRNVDSAQRIGLPNAPPRRRSRSPATARRSPMKKREEAPVKKEETAKVDVEVKKEEDLTVRDPEVSMECFIFL